MPAVTKTKYRVDATWQDVPHLSPEIQSALLEGTPEHMRDARSKGMPTPGEGKIFTTPEETIRSEPFVVPSQWPGILGLDFGWDHPAAVVLLRIDRDAGVVYITNGYKATRASPIQLWDAVRTWAQGWPCAWPRDGLNETQQGGGDALRNQYAKAGFTMLPKHAQFEPAPGKETGSVSVESGIMLMQQMFRQGQLKVFASVGDFWPEYRVYHRKNVNGVSKIVKLQEDMISAVRYALMMQRYARTRIIRHNDMVNNLPFGILDELIGY